MEYEAKAREIMRGYMAPRNDAINQFAQTGKVVNTLVDEIDAEIHTAENEHINTPNDERIYELNAMVVELNKVRKYILERYGSW